ncbi:HAMP domain-containing protein [Solihabitans fulvus]|uniref:histidine kinase n=2 Tax=Solihabitans fulvus TaxID=1892852 RepID=A0A5B2WTC4_9PSEU|nr:HAMP domain-containing protein [Solihabitans fulvus]
MAVVFLLGIGVGCTLLAVMLAPRITEGLTFAYTTASRVLTFSQVSSVGFLAGALLGAALAAFLGWLLAGVLLRPLSLMTAATARLNPQSLGQRVSFTSNSKELGELAGSVDAMLDRLATGFDSQSRFVANASHELRTPLAVQRTLVEVAMQAPDASQDLRRLGAQLLLVNERSERMIEGLLALAVSDRGITGNAPVRLDQLVLGVLNDYREKLAAQGIELTHALDERVVAGDSALLERLVVNLVENAIKYNEPGGWIHVRVGDEPALMVHNSGQRVPAEAVSRLFEPFRRLTNDRTDHGGGAGLGLSIARSITDAHGGGIGAVPGDHGGLRVEVMLPAASL